MKYIVTALLLLTALSACNRKPADPNRTNFILTRDSVQNNGYSTECGIDSINGEAPKGLRYATADNPGQKQIEVKCLHQAKGLLTPKHVYLFTFNLNAQPKATYYLKTFPTSTSLDAWFEANGTPATPRIAGKVEQKPF